jgi:hypothetical protein
MLVALLAMVAPLLLYGRNLMAGEIDRHDDLPCFPRSGNDTGVRMMRYTRWLASSKGPAAMTATWTIFLDSEAAMGKRRGFRSPWI